MGLLINGVWHDQWYDTDKTKGQFVRERSQFPHVIGCDRYPIEANRYHLYVSKACPWAHRALIFRQLKDLSSLITVSYVEPYMGPQGWTFSQSADTVCHKSYLHEIYTLSDPHYSGRVTVPILFDKKTRSIVNNESSQIIRILNKEFDTLTQNTLDFYPEHLREDIDAINDFIYDKINNGVYKVGFATRQDVYEENVQELFDALEKIEVRLDTQNYLVGQTLTEADWRLFTTLIRFDAVYVGHFKCNLKRIQDFQSLTAYLKRLYHHEGVSQTVNFKEIKSHYYLSHLTINPNQIVPMGPYLELTNS